MGKKFNVALALATAAAISYSFLPSQAGKFKRKLHRWSEQTQKTIYLTFDDGPHPVYTVKLLDLLQQYDIKASFFVVGKFAEAHPELVERMAAEGHTIGLHSYTHQSAMIQSAGTVEWDLRKSMEVMKSLGIRPEYYRPPWGHVNWFTLRELRILNLKKVLWDVMAEDWEKDADEEKIQYKLLSRTRPGDIVCLHDRRADAPETGETDELAAVMIAALEKTLPLWIEEGYHFAAL